MSNIPKEYKAVAQRMSDVGLNEKEVLKEVSFALQIIRNSSQLEKCSIESKQAAVLNVAQTGLTLNPVMKLAYLVPRWDNKTRTTICCLEPSYQGLVKLLTDTKSIEAINAQLVYENDEFEVNAAEFENPIHHKPKPFEDRGKIIGVYAIALLPSGAKQAETMSINEIYEIRDRSESYKAFKAGKIKSCVWTTDEGEMARKTVVRRIVKYLPKSDNFEKVSRVIELDESDYRPSDSYKQYVAELLASADIQDRLTFENYEHEIYTCNSSRLNEIADELKQMQPISDRHSMTEINQIVQSKVDKE